MQEPLLRTMCSCSCRTPRSGTARHPVWTKRKVLAASRSSGRPAGCSYEGPSSQLRSFSTASSAFWSGVPERVVPKRFRSGFWSGSGAGSGAGPGGSGAGSGAGFRSGFQSISAAASGAVPERVPRSLRPKPLCQALQDAWSPKTRAYSVLCLMQS